MTSLFSPLLWARERKSSRHPAATFRGLFDLFCLSFVSLHPFPAFALTRDPLGMCRCSVLCLLAVFVYGAAALYAPDEVLELPGMKFKPNYRQWSGYLQASPGKFLHYW